jgi:hypothetical protein
MHGLLGHVFHYLTGKGQLSRRRFSVVVMLALNFIFYFLVPTR